LPASPHPARLPNAAPSALRLLGLIALSIAAEYFIAQSAHAGEAYVKVGLPGVQLGYAQSINEQLGWRFDAGTTGSVNKNSKDGGIDFAGSFKYNRAAVLGDYFPFSGRFRLTGGLTLNQAELTLKSQFDGSTPVTVNGRTVTPAAGDYLNGKLKFPSVMPYLGIGWGHQSREAGLGFVADLGVSIGTAKLTTDTNLVGKYGITQADADAKTAEIEQAIGKVKLLPQASLGLNYRF